jgi:hypothetical protein
MRSWSIAVGIILRLIPICYLTLQAQNSNRLSPALMQINRGGKLVLHMGAFVGDQLVDPRVAR